jgi:ankyrin repeat protein
MSRQLTPQSSLDALKREAKRWLKALRDGDPNARARFANAIASAPPTPTLRDVQHALAREHGFPGWTELREELARRADSHASARDAAVQALLAAADAGDAGRVAQVLDAHPNVVNERALLPGHSGKRTALHFAMNSGSEPVTETLLARGADPNIRDEGDDAMPLHFAAERGYLRIVRMLVEHGADPVGDGTVHELNVLGWATCFDYAYHADVAEYLLDHGARHTIHTAVAMGDVEAVRQIAARAPADLDKAMDHTNRYRRPLHLAVTKRRPESLTTLLELGADPEATDAAGLTPLDQAALHDEREMAHRLRAAGARIRMPAAVALEMPDEVERLSHEEPDSLRPGGRWGTLIIRAAERAPGRVIEALIRGGASVHVRDDHRTAVDGTHGYTALHAAAFHGNLGAARALLRHGASPQDREDRYWGSPAGWAAYAGHTEVRDLILEGAIDLFDAILYDRNDRIPELLARDPEALERRYREYVTGEKTPGAWIDRDWTPAAFAAANGKLDALQLLAHRGANLTVRDSTGRSLLDLATARGHGRMAEYLREREALAAESQPAVGPAGDRVADFLRMACLDWRSSGSARTERMRDAGRLLARHPELARANIYTAVVCGDIDEVRRVLDERPEASTAIGGPRSWPPLLYLCAARLPEAAGSENALEVARLLLDRGADPNAFYLGGNADIHYTALTVTLGRGEELASMHPRARELAQLLLERGADPHDNQVLYNVFADNTSRHLLGDDLIWLLELMYEHSARRGHAVQWADPTWPMFAMRGAASLGDEERIHHGAHFMLSGPVDRNLLALAEWMLTHGADPNTPPGRLWAVPQRSLYEDAVLRGHREMAELLVRFGATPVPPQREPIEDFIDACLQRDRGRIQAILTRHPEFLADHRPMFEAVRRDREDVVELLLELGVSPDVENAAGGRARPLHAAAAHAAERCAKLLIARGADVDWRESSYGAIPLGFASYYQHTRLIDLLGRHSREVWELAHTGRVDRLREVLREAPHLAKIVGKHGDTPLMWLPGDPAVALEIASLLLEHGADPAQRNAQGSTAADNAEWRGMDEVVELLRSHGG